VGTLGVEPGNPLQDGGFEVVMVVPRPVRAIISLLNRPIMDSP
jgi:hypothetical protein